jgi:hypothetical protein
MRKRKVTATPALGTGFTTPTSQADANEFIPGPKLRARLGISAVTLWRWRHDPSAGFPAPKLINGRLYFPWGPVAAWLARQPEAV